MTSVGQTVNYNVLQTYILYCHAIKLAVCEFEPNRRTFEYVFEYEYEYVANFMDMTMKCCDLPHYRKLRL